MNEKLTKIHILSWLAEIANYDFNHSYSDQFITWSIQDDRIWIALDFRQKSQAELFEKLPLKYKGIRQDGTGLMVNMNSIYINLNDFFPIEYPDIISSKLVNSQKHQSTEKGGWYIRGEYFYTYDWEVLLSDGDTIKYHNQRPKMDMIKGDFYYKNRILTKELHKFLSKYSQN